MAPKDEAIDSLDEAWQMINDGDEFDVELALDLIAGAKAYIEQSQPVPGGYALVPVEPTRKMLIDGAKAARDFLSEAGQYPRSRAVYRAMLAAAPKPGDQ